MRLRLGRLIMSFSSAYVFINSPISSREIAVFLKMGHISENFSLKWSGTWMSHSTQPNNVSFLIASRIVCSVIVCTLSKGRRRRAASNEALQLFVGLFHGSPLALPTFYQIESLLTDISTVSARLFQQLFHRFITLRVDFFALVQLAVVPVPITTYMYKKI